MREHDVAGSEAESFRIILMGGMTNIFYENKYK